ncbi:MAG: cytochrome C [Nitrospirae bacterium]|nr:MAG: cytochrome C [Nitrospirota bacterium]
MGFLRVFCLLLVVLLPTTLLAAGAHDSLMCTGCHSIHDAQGKIIFAVKANTVDKNPRTGKAFSGVTALCLGCHDAAEKGGMGIRPIFAHKSHPYGIDKVNKRVARVPKALLRDGRFECVSCHDPHPSNPNYRYLRVDTKGGANMDRFCSLCHPAKVDPKSRVSSKDFFNSMDETKIK